MTEFASLRGGAARLWVVFQNFVVGFVALTLDGAPAESHREYYVGEGFLRGLLLPLIGTTWKARPNRLLRAHGSGLFPLRQFPLSNGESLDVSGGGGVPGVVIRFANAWENESLRLGYVVCGWKLGAAVCVLVEVYPDPRP